MSATKLINKINKLYEEEKINDELYEELKLSFPKSRIGRKRKYRNSAERREANRLYQQNFRKRQKQNKDNSEI